MVNRILDFSSASEGHVQLEPQPFVLARFVELLRQSVAGAALEKKLDLRFVLDPALPATITATSAIWKKFCASSWTMPYATPVAA